MDIPSVSPTRLKTAKICEFKYLLTYIWHWSDKLFQYSFASEFGTAIHNTLEAYAKHRGRLDYKTRYRRQILLQKAFRSDMSKAPSKARASFFKDKTCETCSHFNTAKAHCLLARQHVEHFDGCPRKLYDEGLVMIETAIERYGKYFETGIKNKDNIDGKVIGVEVPADICWGQDSDGDNIVMNGYIDLLVEYDKDTLLVVDYKTGYSTPTFRDFTKDLQPRMYAYAVHEMYPEYKFHWVQFDYFRNVPFEYSFSAQDHEKTRQEVVDLYNKIKDTKVIQRRAYDRECKYLCNRGFCDVKWEELKRGIDGSNPDYKPRSS